MIRQILATKRRRVPSSLSIKTLWNISIISTMFFVSASALVVVPQKNAAVSSRLTCQHWKLKSRPTQKQAWKGLTANTRIVQGIYQDDSGSLTRLHSRYWEGDDLRWQQKLRRRLLSTQNITPVRTSLIILNILSFTYQAINAVSYIRHRHPTHWPNQAIDIVTDTLIGSSILGPFTRDFAHSVVMSRYQPHRYLTSGFLHGSIFHLAVNLDALRRIPQWVESGLGWSLYLTTYIVAIISGNILHTVSSLTQLDQTLVLGASGGICGLYGLMFTANQRMGNAPSSTKAARGNVIQGMVMILIYGFLFSEKVSNSAHIGGFLGGLIIGVLCGPTYRKSYSMRRKGSLDSDVSPADYRAAIGFGKVPTKGMLSIRILWVCAALALASQPKFTSMPKVVMKGLLRPGSLSSMH